MGRFEVYKNSLALLEAAFMLATENIEFHFIGDGSLREVMAQKIVTAGLTQVNLFSWADQQGVIQHLNELRLLILPSTGEGVPNILGEAMACGTPILATVVGGIPELIKHQQTGFILADTDPTTIAQAIRQALAYPEMETIVTQARDHVKANFSAQVVTQLWQNILEEISD